MPADRHLDLVFDRHPTLGIVATDFTQDARHVVPSVLRHTGFQYDPYAKLHVAAQRLPLPEVLARMQRATVVLGMLGCTVRASHAVLVAMLANEPVTEEQQQQKVDALAVFSKPAPAPAGPRGHRPVGPGRAALDPAPGSAPTDPSATNRRRR
ncbi:hypothetical protein ABH940_005579 [Streptacidiphilus sp. BW17]|uniref:hypothetical protein n=1 Tax=Streptacidiphilus sp. BW17 TaxID=3156274 RepID=UPI003512F014